MVVDVLEVHVDVAIVDPLDATPQDDAQDIAQRNDSAPELHQLSAEPNDVPLYPAVVVGIRRPLGEDALFERLDLVFEDVGGSEVTIDYVIEEHVQQHGDRGNAAAEPLEASPYSLDRERFATLPAASDGHHPVPPDKEVDLSEILGVRHDERVRRIGLDLRALTMFLGVFEGERMKLELACQVFEVGAAGVRYVDPDEARGSLDEIGDRIGIFDLRAAPTVECRDTQGHPTGTSTHDTEVLFMPRRRLLTGAVVMVMTIAACSGGSAPKEDENVSVGQGLLETTTSAPAGPAAPAAPGAAPAGTAQDPAAAQPTPPAAEGPANVSVHDDPSGFRMRLTVGDHVRFSTDAVIPLQLEYQNQTKRVLVIETDPQLNFVIRDNSGNDRWRDADCRTDGETGDDTPGYGLAPGEQGQTVSTYPYDERFSRRGGAFDASKCDLPAGKYDVLGVLEWCAADQPNDSGPNAANTCADGTTKLVFSAPVSIELVDT